MRVGAHLWSTERLLQQLEHNDEKAVLLDLEQSDVDLQYIASVKPLGFAYNYCQYFVIRNGQRLPSHAALYTSTVYVQMTVLYRPPF